MNDPNITNDPNELPTGGNSCSSCTGGKGKKGKRPTRGGYSIKKIKDSMSSMWSKTKSGFSKGISKIGSLFKRKIPGSTTTTSKKGGKGGKHKTRKSPNPKR